MESSIVKVFLKKTLQWTLHDLSIIGGKSGQYGPTWLGQIEADIHIEDKK